MKKIHIFLAGLAVCFFSMTGSMAQSAVARANEGTESKVSHSLSFVTPKEENAHNETTKVTSHKTNKRKKNLEAKKKEAESNEDLARVLFTTP